VAEDIELFDAWRNGDESAGNALFDRYFEALYAFFRSKLNDGAEDLVQQTFLAAVRTSDQFRREGTFRAYLYTIARSKLYDFLRVRRRKRDPIDFTEVTMADLGPSPSGWAAKREEEIQLREALRRIPVELQIAIELFYFEGMSASEVATVLEIPEGTVRSRVRRALARLRTELEGMGTAPDVVNKTMTHIGKLVDES
jgi:RNA polymerase sigma-70 factor (ECF subfamily)